MRHRPRTDTNQTEIVALFRALGATVLSLASLGDGTPDLLVGFRGVDQLVELKDGAKPPSKRKLAATQVRWHGAWKGRPPVVIQSIDEALDLLSNMTPAW